ncbi:Small ubiquitin- modifier 1 [Tyrophagus putrescentiae]|nr:Small ubiquitin- modifier 1 [Tyrophagus putrescentiae]
MILDNNNSNNNSSSSVTGGGDQAWDSQLILLKVIDEGAAGNVLFFIQLRAEPMIVLKEAFSDHFGGLVATSLRFMVNGHLIEDTDTPLLLGLNHGDQVEVSQPELLPLELPEFSPPPPPSLSSPEMTLEQHINEIMLWLQEPLTVPPPAYYFG